MRHLLTEAPLGWLRGRGHRRRRKGFRSLFRHSLLAGLLSGGCLVNAPEELEAPTQVPPSVLAHTAGPPNIGYVETATGGTAPVFQVDFVSEDLGESVVGRLYLNLDRERETQIGTVTEGGGSLEDGPRTMRIDWQEARSGLDPGCYTVTMMITHESNYDNSLRPKPIVPSKTAYVTWWIAHSDPAQDISLDQCPQSNISGESMN